MKTFARQNKSHRRGATAAPAAPETGLDHSSVISSLLEAVIVVSPTRGIQIANPAAHELLALDSRHLNAGGGLAGVIALADADGTPLAPGSYPDQIVARTGRAVSGMIVGFTLPDGERIQLKCNAVLVDGTSADDPSIALSLRDITERFAALRRLEYAAEHDLMTGLLNRTQVLDRLEAALRVSRPPHWSLAVMFVDLDHMKRVNDTLGHADGDHALIAIAGRLRTLVPRPGFVGRIGGDEFVMVMENLDPVDVRRISRAVHEAVAEPVDTRGRHLMISASVGLAWVHRQDSRSASEVIRDADDAMYAAKDTGGGRTVDFDSFGQDNVRSIGA